LDKIDRTIDQFPKIVALVNNYDNQFKDLGDILADIDNAALHKQASSSVFRLAKNNTMIEYIDDQLYLEHCSELIREEDKNMVFGYQFTMPKSNPKVKIMKAESFRFWNLTEPNKYCWMKYSGPRYVLVNTTNGCQEDVQEYWINERTVSSHPCNRENQQLEPAQQLYHPDVCRKQVNGDPKDIQVKQFNGFYRIYCFGNNITIANQELSCPEYVFELPVSEKFVLNSENYDLGDVLTVTVNTVELHINNQLTEHLKSDDIKIYGSNLTSPDWSFERLSRITGTIMRNITTIESPIRNKLFDLVKLSMKWISEVIEKFSIAITFILLIAAFLLVIPIVETVLVVYKLAYRAFSAVVSPILNYQTRWRSKRARRQSKKNIRVYLRSWMEDDLSMNDQTD